MNKKNASRHNVLFNHRGGPGRTLDRLRKKNVEIVGFHLPESTAGEKVAIVSEPNARNLRLKRPSGAGSMPELAAR